MSIYRNPFLNLKLCALLSVLAITGGKRAVAQANPTPSAPAQFVSGAVRLPWTRGETRYERHWLTLGALDGVDAKTTGELISSVSFTPPKIGAAQTLANGESARWLPQDSWTDVVDFSSWFSQETAGASALTSAKSLFAYTEVDCGEAKDVDLLLGNEARVTLWLNGQPIVENLEPARALVPDAHAYRLALRPGKNALVLCLQGRPGYPCRLTVRLTPPGAVVSSIAEITPNISEDAASVHILTDARAGTNARAVAVEALAPGGKEVAHGHASRGGTVTFPTQSWAEGPYEFRCATTTAWGEPSVTYLAWYKGNILTAIQDVLRKPLPTDDDPLSLTQRVAIDILRARFAEAGSRDGEVLRTRASLISPLIELKEIEAERNGVPARTRPEGFYRIAYTDPVDGSAQFCRAYLPPGYNPRERWPLVISLHGFNPPNPVYTGWWSVDERHNAQAEQEKVIVLEPHGRGNAQYLGIGEDDVMRALAEAKRLFSVDEDRVYLTGESMGGSGTWLIGSHHADQFAAIAPTFGGWDVRVTPPAGVSIITPRTANQDFAFERGNSFADAENLLNTPIFVHHGDSDRSVPVEASRQIVTQLQRWGYDIRYREVPGYGHEDLGAQKEIYNWFLQHHRQTVPRQVRFRAISLREARSAWLQVRAFTEPEKLIRADAEFTEPGVLRLDTDNVSSLTLNIPPALLGAKGSLKIVWNGDQAFNDFAGGHPISLSATKSLADPGLEKRAGVEGPISDVIRTPFIVVVGTTSTDAAMRTRCREKAEAFRTLWKQWQHTDPRIIDDSAMTPKEEQAYSLVLIGGARENLISQRLAQKLPLTVTANRVTIGDRTWPVKDAVAEMIYPNPLATDKYIVEVAPSSADGMYFWNPALWDIAYGFPNVSCDWIIQDGHRAPAEAISDARDNFIASGFFDTHWRRDDRWTKEGEEKCRMHGELRHAPPLGGLTAPADVLRACEGTYELQPGVYGQISVAQDRLQLSIMGGAPVALLPEAQYEFAVNLIVRPIVFEHDAAGRVTGLMIYNDTRAVHARKLN